MTKPAAPTVAHDVTMATDGVSTLVTDTDNGTVWVALQSVVVSVS